MTATREAVEIVLNIGEPRIMERAVCNVLAFMRQDRDLRYGEPRRDIDFSTSSRNGVPERNGHWRES